MKKSDRRSSTILSAISALLTIACLSGIGLVGCSGDAESDATEQPEATSEVTTEGDNDHGSDDSAATDTPVVTEADTNSEALPAEQPTPDIGWQFEVAANDETGNPEGNVTLVVAGISHVVVAEATTIYDELPTDEYEQYNVPSAALTAARSWWAGHGDILYVIAKEGELVVMQAELDEMTDQGPFREVVRIGGGGGG